jgi:FMN-dependent NADH-azoreductase
MGILDIQSSPRGESSDSINLTKSFIEACKSANSSIVADTLNVWHERLPEFGSEANGAKYKAIRQQPMTEAESKAWEHIQSLIQRFQSARRIVLGTPMWNFGLPYKLKQLIDLVAQRNYLFTYDGKQYGPLLNVEKAVAVYTRGSRYLEGSPIPPSFDPGNLFGLLASASRCSRSSERDRRQRMESRSSATRSEYREWQSSSGTVG